ncbi:hypothetical protein [Mucisphaera calidilacus]|uniref:Uncharacterized protein n=1 Tax=Mucisphaera calidilacus TaxID=2527982 RepID=A0A518BZI5_9BACT|nr:hypothetical protein [Mucisphaera calidilacus]QDU72378.1 hypothetical protein Pan265_22430 [Mucisphaera calidilacus]
MARKTFLAYLREHDCECSEFCGKVLVTRRQRVSAFESRGVRSPLSSDTVTRVCHHLEIPVPDAC